MHANFRVRIRIREKGDIPECLSHMTKQRVPYIAANPTEQWGGKNCIFYWLTMEESTDCRDIAQLHFTGEVDKNFA